MTHKMKQKKKTKRKRGKKQRVNKMKNFSNQGP